MWCEAKGKRLNYTRAKKRRENRNGRRLALSVLRNDWRIRGPMRQEKRGTGEPLFLSVLAFISARGPPRAAGSQEGGGLPFAGEAPPPVGTATHSLAHSKALAAEGSRAATATHLSFLLWPSLFSLSLWPRCCAVRRLSHSAISTLLRFFRLKDEIRSSYFHIWKYRENIRRQQARRETRVCDYDFLSVTCRQAPFFSFPAGSPGLWSARASPGVRVFARSLARSIDSRPDRGLG